MKKFTMFILLVIAAFAVSANAQVIYDENFDYPVGDSIGAHGWVFNTGTTNTIKVVSPGLTFTGYVNSGVGNACHLSNNGNDAYANMNDSVSTNSVYVSFMLNVDSSKATGDYFFALLPNNSTGNYAGRTYIKDTLGGYWIGISKGTSASNTIFWSPTTYNRGTTYCMVVKYTFLTGSNVDDEIRGYVFTSGVPASEPGTPTIGPVTGPATDAPNISRVAIRQGSAATSPTLNIDGFRGQKSWNNLLGITQISTIASDFQLKQNYPNPFNPTTNIEFSLKNSSFVTLKIYNALGIEVTNLVNQNLQQGTHRVNFDAKGLSSGVYFYKLSVTNLVSGENIIDTKSMVLVK